MYDPTRRSKFPWRLWSYKLNSEDLDYQKRFVQEKQEVHTVGDVEDVIEAVFNANPSFPSGTRFGFFKSEIEPWWESDGNFNGGRVHIKFMTPMGLEFFYEYWEILLIRLIEGFFEDMTEHICGAKFKWDPSHHNTLSLWTSDDVTQNKQFQERIISFMETFFGIFNEPNPIEYEISFEAHQTRNKNWE